MTYGIAQIGNGIYARTKQRMSMAGIDFGAGLKVAATCLFNGCGETAISCCDHCDTPFCGEHGSKGGDREGDEDGIGCAVPSQCWQHGGFNADE